MVSRLLAALCIAVSAPSLSGCVMYRLPGIPMQPGAADPYLQNLARRALRYWDADAQLELGIRYEYGRGVPVNWRYAEGFYKQAATSVGSCCWSMGSAGKMSYVPSGRPRK